MDMTSFLKGIAPRATNQLLQSSSPRGSPRAHGWTERPRRSTPSAIECQAVRVLRPDLDDRPSHHEAVMAGATEMDGRDGEKFLVVLRFILTPSGPAPYVKPGRDRYIDCYIRYTQFLAMHTACQSRLWGALSSRV